MNPIDKVTQALLENAKGAPEAAHRILETVAQSMEQQIVARAPHKTGAMAASIEVSFPDPLTLQITADKVALYNEYGTGPRGEFGGPPIVITPKNGKYLVFPGRDGKLVFAKKVVSQGMKARPFIRPVVNEVFKDIGPQLAELAAALDGGK